MPEQKRQTIVAWEGTLDEGQGVCVGSSSKLLNTLPFTRASRVGQPDGRTSPEELLAGAHAQCYIMGLAHVLANAGTPAEHLEVAAECSLQLTQRGPHITQMVLHISGRIPQLKQELFEQAVQRANQLCPISRVLRDNVAIHLEAHLE